MRLCRRRPRLWRWQSLSSSTFVRASLSSSLLYSSHFLNSVVTSFTATLYELRSSIAADKKRELLIEVSKWSGDGLRTTCLKMPTN